MTLNQGYLIAKGASFGLFYFCKAFLPKDLIFEELKI